MPVARFKGAADLDQALEGRLDAVPRSRALAVLPQRVEHEEEEAPAVAAVSYPEAAGAGVARHLGELVRRDRALEVVRAPHLADKLPEPLREAQPGADALEEKVAHGPHVRQRLHHRVDVVGVAEVVEPDEPRQVVNALQVAGQSAAGVQLGHVGRGVPRPQAPLDVVERRLLQRGAGRCVSAPTEDQEEDGQRGSRSAVRSRSGSRSGGGGGTRTCTSYRSGRQYSAVVSRFTNTWWSSSMACAYAGVDLPRPRKNFPHTQHAYTFVSASVAEHTRALSKSKVLRATVSRYSHRLWARFMLVWGRAGSCRWWLAGR